MFWGGAVAGRCAGGGGGGGGGGRGGNKTNSSKPNYHFRVTKTRRGKTEENLEKYKAYPEAANEWFSHGNHLCFEASPVVTANNRPSVLSQCIQQA